MALRFLADHCVSNFIVQTLLKQPMSGISPRSVVMLSREFLLDALREAGFSPSYSRRSKNDLTKNSNPFVRAQSGIAPKTSVSGALIRPRNAD